MQKKAVVLLSGGLDSTTVLAHALTDLADQPRANIEALNVNYGQRHAAEIQSARRVAQFYGVKLHEITLCHHDVDVGIDGAHPVRDPGVSWGGSALLNDHEVPIARSVEDMGKDIPITYVPARNLFLCGLATSLAESIGARSVYVGFNALDYSGYPDCRPEFAVAMVQAMALGTKCGVEKDPINLIAPIIMKTKADIIRDAVRLKAPIRLTWSCYNPIRADDMDMGMNVTWVHNSHPCGKCDSCLLRAKGFAEVGIPDPALTK